MTISLKNVGNSPSSAARRLKLISRSRFSAPTLVEDANPPKAAAKLPTRRAKASKPTRFKVKTSKGLRRIHVWNIEDRMIHFVKIDGRVWFVKLA